MNIFKDELYDILRESWVTDLKTAELKQIIGNPKSFLYYNFLIWLAKKGKPEVIVELGTNKGSGALAFRIGAPCARIVTVDIRPSPNAQSLKQHKIEHIISDSCSPPVVDGIKDGTVDILFVDAQHTVGAVLKDYFTWWPKVSQNGVILVDDIGLMDGRAFNPGKEMSHMPYAWQLIKEYQGVCFEFPCLHPAAGFGIVLKL
jgi:predicted O-methyltransferase YrrM